MVKGSDFDTRFSETHITSFDGLSLFLRIYAPRHKAARAPVLCLPGLSRNGKDFHELAVRLSAHRKVLCPDYRGVGRSAYAKNPRSYCPQAWIADIHHLLVATNQHRVAVIGTSFGGVLAAAMAVAMPCAVAGVVLNDIGPDVIPGGLDRVLAHIDAQHRFGNWEEAVDYLKRTFPNLPATNEEGWLRIAHNTFREQAGILINDWDREMSQSAPGVIKNTPDLWLAFRALSRIPALSVRGEKSDILSVRTHRRMAAEIPGLDQITVPGVGHAPDLAEMRLAAKIEAFLDTL